MADLNDLERRIEALERDKNGLEWMVVYLARKSLMREADPLAAARALEKEVDQWAMDFIAYMNQPEKPMEHGLKAFQLGSDIKSLAEQIVEAVEIHTQNDDS